MKVVGGRSGNIDLEEFLSRPLFAHLATSSEHGPRNSPVWFLWEEEHLWIIGNRGYNSFPARVEKDPRCAIGIVDFDRAIGLVHHVSVRGRASVVPWDKERAKRLLRRYLGAREDLWDAARFVDPLGDPQNVLVRLRPETVVVRDQSYRASPR